MYDDLGFANVMDGLYFKKCLRNVCGFFPRILFSLSWALRGGRKRNVWEERKKIL